MSDYTAEANYKEFVAVLAETLGRTDEFAEEVAAAIVRGAHALPLNEMRATCARLGIRPTQEKIREYLTGTFRSVQS